MTAIADPTRALARGLQAIRTELGVPAGFPAPVLAAANEAARRAPTAHLDRTATRFITLDPAGSTDLDQAFAIQASGGDLLLHYAIADVAWFVDDGGTLDQEAWTRGETLYLPDGKAGLYPPVLAEGAASLLPDGPRPAVVFTVRVDGAGAAALDGVERAVIRSRAKLAYDSVTAADLPPAFAELTSRLAAAERARGATRVDPPEQEVAAVAGGYALSFRPRLPSEDGNAALSLACNLAVADALSRHHTGLFRVMAPPDTRAVARLRQVAAGLGVAWPAETSPEAFQRGLDPADARAAALMTAIRRAGHGASYQPWQDGVVPWHAAVAATYAHATAPLRRLADRYVIGAALAVGNGRPVPDAVAAAFQRLPAVMARAEAQAGRIDRAVIDLAEAVVLQGRVGERFAATVIDADEKGARVQLRDVPVVARLSGPGMVAGDALMLHLDGADPARRAVSFSRA